ncbi:DNA integrity scanning diadenylate cyclase DisA [Pseudoglutamicibacter cumminsii]|uniref:DNA integrity scanning diadenylate cyclase DisA n=1 Tax=Pseudoglutamicibacter cumminsii TaxID=156979 RepID=UPI0023BAE825|nr:DNA integrity scanning diadenylate cyclase DisA [Pseudoglutamicibacter cumminsii]
MQPEQAETLRQVMVKIAPGTELRDGLERILRGRTGALIVLGFDRGIEQLTTGGFPIDIEFSPTRLRELAKMDGAIILSKDLTRILHAGIHLVPDPTIPATETGTRHRTAEQTSIQTGYPVIAVSQSMNTITIYVDGQRHQLEGSETILARATQALSTLERYKTRLVEVTNALSNQEIENVVKVRDVATVIQRLEMVRRISEEIRRDILELGVNGRLVGLHLEELSTGAGPSLSVVLRDYANAARRAGMGDTIVDINQIEQQLAALDSPHLVDLGQIAMLLGFPDGASDLDHHVEPRGFRLLSGITSLPQHLVERVVQRFDGLQELMAANVDDLQKIEGIGEGRARSVREGLSRFAEDSLLERYR